MSQSNRWKFGILGSIVFVACGYFLTREVQKVRDAALRTTCNCNMCTISVAMNRYHDDEGHFPPAYVLGPDGKPWHSWRVLLLPYIEEQKLHKRYRFDEPWNGPNNTLLTSEMPRCYICPSHRDHIAQGLTNYFVVVGNDTMFPGAETKTFKDCKKPPGQIICMVESDRQDINWMEPRDIAMDNIQYNANQSCPGCISSDHTMPNVMYVDGGRSSVPLVSHAELREMFKIK